MKNVAYIRVLPRGAEPTPSSGFGLGSSTQISVQAALVVQLHATARLVKSRETMVSSDAVATDVDEDYSGVATRLPIKQMVAIL